jgi:hypothetical protein
MKYGAMMTRPTSDSPSATHLPWCMLPIFPNHTLGLPLYCPRCRQTSLSSISLGTPWCSQSTPLLYCILVSFLLAFDVSGAHGTFVYKPRMYCIIQHGTITQYFSPESSPSLESPRVPYESFRASQYSNVEPECRQLRDELVLSGPFL